MTEMTVIYEPLLRGQITRTFVIACHSCHRATTTTTEWWQIGREGGIMKVFIACGGGTPPGQPGPPPYYYPYQPPPDRTGSPHRAILGAMGPYTPMSGP